MSDCDAVALPFRVRLRPNAPYLAMLAVSAAAVAYGISLKGITGFAIIVSGAVFGAFFAVPALISTVCRVPLLAADIDGVRLPLMGVRLAWSDIATVRQSSDPTRPKLLIVPTDVPDVLAHMRPWLRSEGRSNISRYGTPIVVPPQSMDHTLDQMHAALTKFLSAASSPHEQ